MESTGKLSEAPMIRSGMTRSSMGSVISRIGVQQPPSAGNIVPKYCVLLLIVFSTMVVVGIGVHMAFLKKNPMEQLEERITPQKCEEAFAEFKKMKREFGNITKLVSFPVHEIDAIDMADIDKAFASIRGGLLDGIDIRYIHATERSIHKLKELRNLADQKKYLIHGVFEKVNINVMRHFHLASIRVYTTGSQGPYKAAPVQPSENVETAVAAYAAAVIDAKLESFGNHCVAFTLAPVRFPGAHQLEDHAYGVKKYEYCTDYNQADARRDSVDLSHSVNDNAALVVFDKAEDFANKVEKIGALPNACVLLDNVYYDSHNCSCDDKNFKLIRAARRVLWQTLRR
ncbi:uncharacterized protein [Dermacentor albipictus]|uniref:uncharacterized protein isoform X3 n=1 Tax=Dermacentor albipictus TaxID=60249 RepID=UPI0038FC5E08